MKKVLQKRLAKYGMLAAAITGAESAEGAVIYTDETPDFAGGVGSQYFLDLDNNAVDDFRIWHNGGSNLYISPLTATNEVLGSGGATFAYPFALTSGAVISSGAGTFFNNGFAGGFQSLNYGSCSFGNWCTVTDRYIGVRFDIGGSIHYGWVRLDVNQSGSVWTVKDYAYETNMGASILAGDVGGGGSSASPSSLIVGTDIADNANGLDLQIDFTAATDETTISEYRLIAVKGALVGTFDQVAAEALPAANYISVAPTGSPTYTQILNAGSIDSDGDPIVLGQPYRIFILNMADGVNASVNSLSFAAADVTLNTPTDFALSIVGSDVADNADASDLQADFDAAASENGISEYRVIAVKNASVPAFDLAAAQATPASAYETVAPSGGPYTVNFNAITTDSDGDPIVLAQPYTLFVLSVADGMSANIDNIANAATDVTLNVTTETASGIVGTDIDDFANGLDLQVDFTPPGNESGILAYRVIAVKAASAGAFNLAAGLALPSTAWMFVTPTGAASYTTVFEALKTDSDGDPIVENQPYTIFVISFADTQLATESSMASSASDVTLLSHIGLVEGSLDNLSAFADGENIIINSPEGSLSTTINVELVNIQGQLIKSVKLKDTKTIIETAGLVSGMYFVHFNDKSGNSKTIKIYL